MLGVRVTAVVLLFALVLEGPDLLLVAVLDVWRWLPIGLATGVATVPLIRLTGAGFAPPWTLPAYADDASRSLASLWHLLCTVVGAWLWTQPTLAVVAWVHRTRGFEPVPVGSVPPDVVSVAAGLILAGLLLFAPALVVFVRLSTFRTAVDLEATPSADILRPAVVGVGGTVAVGVVVSLLAASFSSVPPLALG